MGRYEIIRQQVRSAVYKAVDTQTDSYFVVDPERGGIVTEFYAGRPVFYMDRNTYEDPSRYVRGGNPVLFPIVGKLTDDCFFVQGKPHTIPIHGLARNAVWQLEDQETEDCARLTLRLNSTQAMLAQYPFPFSLHFSYSLRGNCLSVEQRYENTGSEPMPAAFGFHPYFFVPQKETASLTVSAAEYLNMQTGRLAPYPGGIRLDQPEELGYLLLDVSAKQAVLQYGQGAVQVDFDAPFRHVLVWSLPNAPFVCVEPWTARPDALNTQEEVILIPPGETLKTKVSYTAL